MGNLNERLAALVALALFLMLWLPLGQIDFMVQHWMKVGTYFAPILLLACLAASARSPSTADPLFMSVALLVIYVAHQFEEHWIDLLGNEYAFYEYINSSIRALIGPGGDSVEPLTPMSIYMINTSLVWLVGVLAILRARRHMFPVLALTSITLVNGMTHIVASLATLSYNPGLLTSIALFLPVSGAYFYSLIRHKPELKPQIITSLLWAGFAHVLMVSGMLAANLFGVITEDAYFALLVLCSLLPLALFRSTQEE